LIGEGYRLNCSNLKAGHDFIFIARNASKERSYKEIESAIINLFKKSGLSD
jgi:ribonuclease P protein component